ncbi:helix-loop-helix domain-containing protein [Clostridiaceae bacterium NSJ-31]|uniref:Helix-loop-helix domain-containing protein n=1 Tax=Ligaoa zhengdingensis TaxID=2763658 RepID=A0A926HZ61_9FIRM|nr:hypothetical protein [Ligaoa zhengdingensis]MBC8545582.1 helix-loop-helix domain-containing protein [Ligaoa zhengdingensis]
MKRKGSKIGLGRMSVAVVLVSTIVSVVTVILSNAAERRLHNKLMRCMDDLQQALPEIQKASKLYVAGHQPAGETAGMPAPGEE